MRAAEEQVFQFGEFTLAPNERLLLCGAEPVPLSPKALDVLVALVRRSGRLVTKDELLREVWPGTFVEEVNLTVHVSALRKALDRGRSGVAMIQTVPTHGYRFVAPVMAANGPLVLRDPKVSILERTSRELGRQLTENADAYRAYLQGRYEWNQRSEESLKRGIDYFLSAVEIDPQFAAAYSGLADCYAALGYLSYTSPAEAFPSARQHAAKALQLDASLAEHMPLWDS